MLFHLRGSTQTLTRVGPHSKKISKSTVVSRNLPPKSGSDPKKSNLHDSIDNDRLPRSLIRYRVHRGAERDQSQSTYLETKY